MARDGGTGIGIGSYRGRRIYAYSGSGVCRLCNTVAGDVTLQEVQWLERRGLGDDKSVSYGGCMHETYSNDGTNQETR